MIAFPDFNVVSNKKILNTNNTQAAFASRQIKLQLKQQLLKDTVCFSGKQPVFTGKINDERLTIPLNKASTTIEFITQMKEVIKDSDWVQIDNKQLANVAGSFKEAPKLLDWKGYISDEVFNASSPDLNRAMFELVLNIANQSGFIVETPDGKAKKWEINGSGARAMVGVIANMRDQGLLPGINIKNPDEVSEKIGPLIKDVPYKDNRIAIFEEYTGIQAYNKISTILEEARTGDHSYKFNFDTVKKLAQAFPNSFGNDPFYKKASLVLIAMAGFARPRGTEVQLDIPVASDYRLPQTLEALGILHFSPKLEKALEEGQCFHEDHPIVQHLRAASVVVSDEISKQTGFDSAAIDGLLWGASRNPESIPGIKNYEPKPHIMVPTMRF